MGEIFTVTLPDIGEGVVEGEVVEWLKNVGDRLAQDEPVVVVMTDKATVELPAPHPGLLSKQYYRPGEIAIKGKPLYDISLEGTSPSIPSKQEPAQQEIPKNPATPMNPIRSISSENRAIAIPSVRRMAKDIGIDIDQISGTGKEGRVTAEDLKKSCTPSHTPVTHFPDDQEEAVMGIRGVMAKKMAESKRTIPHFSYHETVEVARLPKLRDTMKKKGEQEKIQVTYMPFFIRALSLTLLQYPLINSSYDEEVGKILVHKQHNISVAMSTEKGLIVPVLKGVQELFLNEIIRAYDSLRKKAADGKLEPKDMKESTITISNFGVLGSGGLWATPIINYPEAAIIALNKIQKQPVVKNDQVIPIETLNISWSFDHRFIDGHLAAQVSSCFCHLLHNPAQLL